MADFGTKTIKQAYPGILHTDSGGDAVNITSTARNVLAGSGGASKLWLSTARVGIGVTPTKFFHVQDGNSQLHFEESADDALFSIIAKGTDTNWAVLRFGDANDTIQAAIMYDCATQKLYIRGDDNADVITLDSSSRVGIGVTAPDTKLEVYHTGATQLKLSHNDTDFATFGVGDDQVLTITAAGGIKIPQEQKLMFDSADTYIMADATNPEHLEVHVDASLKLQPDDDILVYTAGEGTEWVRFDGSEKRVGIGVSAPQADLHIANNTSDYPKIILDNESPTDTQQGGTLSFIRRDSTPGHLVDDSVIGDIMFIGTEDDGSTEIVGAYIRAITTDLWSDTSSPTELTFNTCNASSQTANQRMCIRHDGKVGIGTTAPATTLDVEGSFSGKNIEQTTGTVNSLSGSGCTVLELNTASGNITLNGLANGAEGQILYVYKSNLSGTVTVNHASASASAGNKIYTRSAGNPVLADGDFGGFVLVYGPDGGNDNRWFMLDIDLGADD